MFCCCAEFNFRCNKNDVTLQRHLAVHFFYFRRCSMYNSHMLLTCAQAQRAVQVTNKHLLFCEYRSWFLFVNRNCLFKLLIKQVFVIFYLLFLFWCFLLKLSIVANTCFYLLTGCSRENHVFCNTHSTCCLNWFC